MDGMERDGARDPRHPQSNQYPSHHRARQLATERRRKTLLVEYQALKKDNVFRDRRFGEADPTLSLEEKMLLRFQKERQRRARAGAGGKAGRFNLEEGDDEEYEEDEEDEEYGGLRLTHKGKALGADDYRDQDALGSSDEEEEDAAGGGLNRQIVQVCLGWFLLRSMPQSRRHEGRSTHSTPPQHSDQPPA